MSELTDRLRLDVKCIRKANDRTGKLAERIFRWVGEPNGWRKMSDLADDIEQLLKENQNEN